MTEELITSSEESSLLEDPFENPPQKKYKILMLSDHPLAPSGVGIQSRILIDQLISTGKYSFRCFGGAIKHQKYETVAVNQDFIIKPVDGFGTPELLRQTLLMERPDALILFTDPRQFIWVWEMADEIRQICPIAYWHIWDNDPYPAFNNVWYEGTDLINCISRKTYDLVKPHFPEKTHYIPHAFPKEMYHPLPKVSVEESKKKSFGVHADWFKVLWVNRNATRKVPGDVMSSFKEFLGNLEKEEGHRKALLIMHTDPGDREGPNLLAVAHELGIQDNVWFSTDKLSFADMNTLHNVVDCTINISKNEGWGLSTHISLQVGKPIIALKTGGETTKAVDYRDGTANGVALDPIKRSLVGSQLVPYIYEDYASTEETANAFMTLYKMSEEEKEALSKKCIEYADHAFNIDYVREKWDSTLEKCIEDFKAGKLRRWNLMPMPEFSTPNKQVSNEPKPLPSDKSMKTKGGREIKTIKAKL